MSIVLLLLTRIKDNPETIVISVYLLNAKKGLWQANVGLASS